LFSVPDPVIVARANHPISRKNIDSDALRVLYRLHEHRYQAYLVGGSVRDLLLGRHPKDFDIGTDAHPYQIKKLFRNCWIIGRRFRLAHIKYGTKTIEVATFRKNVPDGAADNVEAPADDAIVVATSPAAEPGNDQAPDDQPPMTEAGPAPDTAIPTGGHAGHDRGSMHRDNTFGTPEEDAFRRDFTINGLFYDISTFSVIDYVGGLEDLERRIIRSIGDPRVRFVEDPVRMLRAAVFGARLGFDLDPLVIDAIDEHRGLIATASPARLIEEYYKILRSGCAEASFRALGRLRLLELITPELKDPSNAIWDGLAKLDAYRRRSPTVPAEFTNTVLIGSLLVPMGVLNRKPTPAQAHRDPRGERVDFGMLPVARKDIERLRQLVQITPRLNEPELPARLIRSLIHRPAFDDALSWLQIFDDAPDAVARWKEAVLHRQPHQPRHHPQSQSQPQHGHAGQHGQRGHHAHPQHAAGPRPHHPADATQGDQPGDGSRRRRRRRRRGRRRGGGGGAGGGGTAAT
jgi:poly(A) polymerase